MDYGLKQLVFTPALQLNCEGTTQEKRNTVKNHHLWNEVGWSTNRVLRRVHQRQSGQGLVSLKSRNCRLKWSPKRRRLEVRTVILIFVPFNTWKGQLYRISALEFYDWLFRPEKFSGRSRNGPLSGIWNRIICMQAERPPHIDQSSYLPLPQWAVPWFPQDPMLLAQTSQQHSLLMAAMIQTPAKLLGTLLRSWSPTNKQKLIVFSLFQSS